MAKKRMTIKEIAQLSGVSVSTVSRVLNNHPSVIPAKREKVLEIIRQYHFQPSQLARGMVSQRTNTFAVIVSDIANPYFTSMIDEIESCSRELGYALLLVNTMTAGSHKTANAIKEEIRILNTIQEHRVDGILILGGHIDRVDVDMTYLETLNALNKEIPVVIIGQKHAQCECTFISRNIRKGIALLTAHLLALGHQKIAFLGGEPGVRITEERVEAFKETLSVYVNIDPDDIILNDYYSKDGYEGARQLMAQAHSLPTAVIAINDNVALGAIRAFADAGIHCPQDIKVVSCDRFANTEFQIPRLTTIDQHHEYLGRVAVQTLMNLIHENKESIPYYHEPELIIRESCGIQLKKQREINHGK